MHKLNIKNAMENKLPEKFVVSKKPKEIRKQGLRHCGAFSVAAILEAYSKIDNIGHPRNLYLWWIVILPTPNLWIRVFKKYGIDAGIKSSEGLSDNGKIDLLKRLLSEDKPVMLLVGNGYWRGKYSKLRSRLIWHWITLWGYDDLKKIFYVYDSAVPKNLYDDIPVGNKMRNYSDIIRDWKSSYFPGLLGRCVYIFIR